MLRHLFRHSLSIIYSLACSFSTLDLFIYLFFGLCTRLIHANITHAAQVFHDALRTKAKDKEEAAKAKAEADEAARRAAEAAKIAADHAQRAARERERANRGFFQKVFANSPEQQQQQSFSSSASAPVSSATVQQKTQQGRAVAAPTAAAAASGETPCVCLSSRMCMYLVLSYTLPLPATYARVCLFVCYDLPP
jgi:hypothetical protein